MQKYSHYTNITPMKPVRMSVEHILCFLLHQMVLCVGRRELRAHHSQLLPAFYFSSTTTTVVAYSNYK
jgi:hypothetical protein